MGRGLIFFFHPLEIQILKQQIRSSQSANRSLHANHALYLLSPVAQDSIKCLVRFILGDPGAVSGGGKSLNGREKNSAEEKSRTRRRAPGEKVLTNQFQTVGVILASDWCQKTWENWESFRDSLHHRYIQASCSPCLLAEKRANHSTKCREDRSAYPQETRDKYAGPFKGIATLAHLTD